MALFLMAAQSFRSHLVFPNTGPKDLWLLMGATLVRMTEDI